MTGRHLGERIHDLLDNRLSRPEAAEAMAHLEECAECARRWHELRRAREALHSSEAGIDLRFTRQLRDRDRMAEIASTETRRRVRAARGRDRRPAVLTLSVALLVVALLGAAYVAGDLDDLDPELTASSEAGAVSVARIGPSALREGEGLGAWIHPDWQSSGIEPVDAAIKQTPNGASVLVATLLHGADQVLMVEQQGCLKPEAVAGLELADVDGIDAYVVGNDPSRLAWQAGTTVVILECDCAMQALEEVAAAFPQDDEPTAVDQVITGLGVFANALTGR